MIAAIREILQYVSDHREMTTRAAVGAYFDRIIWSSEQAEWKTFTEKEQQQFIDQIDAAKRKAPEGASVRR